MLQQCFKDIHSLKIVQWRILDWLCLRKLLLKCAMTRAWPIITHHIVFSDTFEDNEYLRQPNINFGQCLDGILDTSVPTGVYLHWCPDVDRQQQPQHSSISSQVWDHYWRQGGVLVGMLKEKSDRRRHLCLHGIYCSDQKVLEVWPPKSQVSKPK